MPTERRPDARDAYRLARQKYLAGEPLEIGRLATELGVSRVTVYRWVGTKDSLLVEVIWALTDVSLSIAWERVRNQPGPRIPALLGHHLRSVMEQPGARSVAMRHDERLMRLLTLPLHDYQPRLLRAVRGYVAEDLAERRIVSDLTLDDLTFAAVQICDSYHYLPTIAGQPPDPDSAQRVLAELFRSPA